MSIDLTVINHDIGSLRSYRTYRRTRDAAGAPPWLERLGDSLPTLVAEVERQEREIQELTVSNELLGSSEWQRQMVESQGAWQRDERALLVAEVERLQALLATPGDGLTKMRVLLDRQLTAVAEVERLRGEKRHLALAICRLLTADSPTWADVHEQEIAEAIDAVPTPTPFVWDWQATADALVAETEE